MNNKKNRIENAKITAIYIVIILSSFIFFKGCISTSMINENNFLKLVVKNVIPYFNNGEYDYEHNDGERNVILSYLYNKIFNPVNVAKQEMPMLKASNKSFDNMEANESDIAKIDPYNLDSNSIVKLNPEETKGTKGLSVSKAFDKSLVKQLNEGKPEVLIYHSHTMEAYGTSADSADTSKSVIGVGAALQDELKKYGISSINDTTISRSYEKSYERSRNTVKSYLNKYGDFKIIIDLHRDSVPNKVNVTTTLNGEKLAKIMFVTANNNPHASDNHKLINDLNERCRKLFPGLSRGITSYRNGKSNSFNQDLSKNSILIEVGSEQNTPEEAKTSAKYIARIIAEKINGKWLCMEKLIKSA